MKMQDFTDKKVGPGLDLQGIIAEELNRPDTAAEASKALVDRTATIDYSKLPDGDYLVQVFGANGLLAQTAPDYELRQGQVDMARLVHTAIFSGQHCLADAPCGVGKSVAYSVPAIANAVTNTVRIVIATENIALQEQLYDSDLPALHTVLSGCFPFNYALLKGRNNYWCKEQAFKSEVNGIEKELSGVKRSAWKRLNAWAKTSEDGDKSHIPFYFAPELWAHASCTSDDCRGDACSARDACFYEKVKAKALAAHVVVTNYHMLLRGLAQSPSIQRGDEAQPKGIEHVSLGAFNVLILDEAHNLAKVARDCFGFSLSAATLAQLRKWLSTTANKTRAEAVSQRLLDSSTLFFEAARQAASDPSKQDCRLIAKDWAMGAEKGLLSALAEVIHIAEAYAQQPDASPESRTDAANAYRKASNFRKNLADAASLVYPEKTVYWVDAFKPTHVRVESKPIDVAPMLKSLLYNRMHSVTLTSATLAIGTSFEFVRRETGLEDALELIADSPFDFSRQCWISVPKDMPAVGTRTYDAAATWLISEIIKLSRGRALCLFSSNAQLNAIYQAVSKNLQGSKINLLLQRHGVSRKALREEFKTDVHSCLFGVSSFWTGIDVSGEALTGLVIDKLPFPNIKDPIYKAREALEPRRGDFFNTWAVPTMLITLRQGIGRLIRRADDMGFIVLLDSRVWTKSYGKRVQKALPKGIQWAHDLDGLKAAISLIDGHRGQQRLAQLS